MKIKQYKNKIIRTALVISAFAFLLTQHQLNFNQHQFSAQFFLGLSLASLVFFLPYIVNSLRFRLLLRGQSISLRLILHSQISSAFLGLIFPGRLSEFVKVTFLHENGDIPYQNGLVALATEKFFDLLIILLLILNFLLIETPTVVKITASTILLILPFVMVPVLKGLSNLNKIKKSPRLAAFTALLLICFKQSLELKSYVLLLFLSTLSSSIFALGCFLFMAFGLDANLSITQLIGLMLAFLVSLSVPFFPGGLGIVQLSLTTTLNHYGLDSTTSILASFAIHLSLNLLVLIYFPLVYFRYPMGLNSIFEKLKKHSQDGKNV